MLEWVLAPEADCGLGLHMRAAFCGAARSGQRHVLEYLYHKAAAQGQQAVADLMRSSAPLVDLLAAL